MIQVIRAAECAAPDFRSDDSPAVKAKELGMDWWAANPAFSPQTPNAELAASLGKIDERLGRLESAMAAAGA